MEVVKQKVAHHVNWPMFTACQTPQKSSSREKHAAKPRLNLPLGLGSRRALWLPGRTTRTRYRRGCGAGWPNRARFRQVSRLISCCGPRMPRPLRASAWMNGSPMQCARSSKTPACHQVNCPPPQSPRQNRRQSAAKRQRSRDSRPLDHFGGMTVAVSPARMMMVPSDAL